MARTPSTMQELGSQMPTFQLKDHAGNTHTNHPHESRGSLVMFLSSHCPFVILLNEHLALLTQEYADDIAIVIHILLETIAVVAISAALPVPF